MARLLGGLRLRLVPRPAAPLVVLVRVRVPVRVLVAVRLVRSTPVLEVTFEDIAGLTFAKEAIVAFLRETTMVGLLPVPHPIVVRKYQPNEHTDLWFTTFIWGTVFLRSQLSDDEVPLFDSGKIRLFGVNHFEQVRGPEAV